MRVRPLRLVRTHPAHIWRAFTLLAALCLLVPLHAAASAAPLRVAHAELVVPASVGRGAGADLQGRLTVAGEPVSGLDVVFLARPAAGGDWQRLGVARTGFGGWASWQVPAVTAPTDFGVYYPGALGVARSAPSTATVHVVDVAATAPDRVRRGHPVVVAGRLTLDGRALAAQPLHFMFRSRPDGRWRSAHWNVVDRHGWARVQQQFAHTFQVGVRFDGSSDYAASPLVVRTVRVVAPPRPPAFVFPFADPGRAASPSSWSEDQGVDLAYAGYGCGSSAGLVAIGDGVVVQEGISGFGPTAPVLRMTSGVFDGRYVYYGHTGRVFVHVGDAVHAGQRIAEVGCGSVGYSAAPHLEIGVGVPGGPTCCPAEHQTSGEMMRQLQKAYGS